MGDESVTPLQDIFSLERLRCKYVGKVLDDEMFDVIVVISYIY